jgi:hypothetical protein
MMLASRSFFALAPFGLDAACSGHHAQALAFVVAAD